MNRKSDLKHRFAATCTVFLVSIFVSLMFGLGASADSTPVVGQACNKDGFKETLLGLPAWYKYLPGEGVQQKKADGTPGDVICQPTIKTVTKVDGKEETIPVNNILLIVAAVIEILIRVAGMAAFIYLIYGGFMYLTSSGNSENISKAGTTLLNAAIGLGIAISGSAIINFFASRLKGT